MPSAKKDRVTVSFHIDKKLHALLKRCSSIEDLPMSRIIDSVLRPYVEKYQFNTLEEWEIAEEFLEMERAYEAEEASHEEPSESEMIKANAENLRKMLDHIEKIKGEGKLSEEKYEILKQHCMANFSKVEEKALEASKREREEKCRKWESVCKDFPLE